MPSSEFCNISLENRVIIVTGAGGGGLGEAGVKLLAARGASVMVADIDEAEALRVAEEIRAAGGRSTHCVADCLVEDQMEETVSRTISTFGKLDGAWNNVGGSCGTNSRLVDMDLEMFDRITKFNLYTIFLAMKHQIKAMIALGGGSVVNTCSTAGVVAIPNIGHYVAAKHAVLGLTKVAAVEYGGENIRVNCILPGTIETPQMQRAFALNGLRDRMAADLPIGRFGQPSDIAEMVAFLLSDAASFITGAGYIIDGGFTAL